MSSNPLTIPHHMSTYNLTPPYHVPRGKTPLLVRGELTPHQGPGGRLRGGSHPPCFVNEESPRKKLSKTYGTRTPC